jgi:hypothetical protein
MKRIFAVFWIRVFVAAIVCSPLAKAQTKYTAVQMPSGTAGNLAPGAWGFGSDFYVNQPVTVWELGIFDDRSDGIQGDGVLTAQLYSHHGSTATLLETVTFDLANSGTQVGGGRFKSLANPVTLLPGSYSIIAYGFNRTNRVAQLSRPPYTNGTPWSLNEGGGLIHFEQGRHGAGLPGEFPHGINTNRPDYYLAGSFTYSAATLPTPSYAADYAALVSGVTQIPFAGARRAGSIAIFDQNSFPVLVEPDGNRLVLEAAGKYNNDLNGARAVLFSHSEFGRAGADARATLFENAVKWASRKSTPSDIVIGMGPELGTNYFISRGYHVLMLSNLMDSATASIPPCDVVVVNGNSPFTAKIAAKIASYTAQGGGLVFTMMPWELLHGAIQPEFAIINHLVQPYGLAYRPSTTYPTSLGFTNISAQAFPVYFSAYPAATLLGQDRLGQVHLTSLEKVIALNTINYAVNARPEVMADLTALSSGGSTNGGLPETTSSGFSDLVVLKGADASATRLGQWTVDGDDVVATDRRGAVFYNFTTSQADLYKLQVIGTQNQRFNLGNDFDLVFSLDGVNLGHHHLVAGYGVDGMAECFTPFIPAGAHTLRIYWDNPRSYTSLRLKSIHVQSGGGPDSDGNGIRDWVDQLVQSQSGLDITNAAISSFVSPLCLEGRDPYLSLMQLSVQGSSSQNPAIRNAPNGRWFSEIPLPPDQNTLLVLNASFQNNALTQIRQIQWKPINLLTTSNLTWTIRKGDSLLLGARPVPGTNAPVCITVGTNQRNTTANNPIAMRFAETGTFTVTGTYTGAVVQARSITVNVVGYKFPNNPDVWALHERGWDLTNVPPEVTLEGDDRIIMEQLAALPDGQRMGLIADQNEPRLVLARMGAHGPILDLARMNNFELWSGGSTYVKVLQTYPDGSELVEMMIIVSPIPADLSVRLDVIVGGVLFDDGSMTKTLTSADFDQLNRAVVHFIRPASAKTSVCHSLKVFQGTAFVGSN